MYYVWNLLWFHGKKLPFIRWNQSSLNLRFQKAFFFNVKLFDLCSGQLSDNEFSSEWFLWKVRICSSIRSIGAQRSHLFSEHTFKKVIWKSDSCARMHCKHILFMIKLCDLSQSSIHLLGIFDSSEDSTFKRDDYIEELRRSSPLLDYSRESFTIPRRATWPGGKWQSPPMRICRCLPEERIDRSPKPTQLSSARW